MLSRQSLRLAGAVGLLVVLGLAQSAAAVPAAAETCTVTMPRHVVLRAQGIQTPYSIGARWGECPEGFRSSGYHTWLPGYSDHPITWVFHPIRTAKVSWAKEAPGFIPVTSFDGMVPQLGDVGTGGDPMAIVPGTYEFGPPDDPYGEWQTSDPDVRLRATPQRIVAKYWSALGITATRDRGTTVVTVVGRNDQISFNRGNGLRHRKDVPAAGASVRLYRDGKLVKTVELDEQGTAVVRVRSSQAAHRYRAVMAGIPLNWPAYATTTTPPA